MESEPESDLWVPNFVFTCVSDNIAGDIGEFYEMPIVSIPQWKVDLLIFQF